MNIIVVIHIKRCRPLCLSAKATEGDLSITPDRRKTLVFFTKSQETCSLKAVLRCKGGDLSAVVPSASRRPRTSLAYVKAGSCTVPLSTPAFQFCGSVELQRRCSFPFGSLRLPKVPLGGFATSLTPLAAVAARGAEYNINGIDVASADIV